ncbi:uncharacterized protein NKAPD1-like isoform X1 [Oscarella lobularis]|uniref:uncharacterized protein NKAPD1-like isoform X1 n=1 Tax=Oscarella lobularis TaxID=121494 RepID=UPI0033140FEE
MSSKREIDKGLLSNIIRHTDAHNRVREEREMWRLYEQEKRAPSRRRDRRHSDESLLTRYRHRDSLRRRRKDDKDEEDSFHWTRKLMEMEEDDPTRWGHSGYKELHPEEFGLPSAAREKSPPKTKKLKKDKKRKKKSSSKTKKKKKRKKEEKDTDTEYSTEEEDSSSYNSPNTDR